MKATQDTQNPVPKKSPNTCKYAELGHGSAGPILVLPIFETVSQNENFKRWYSLFHKGSYDLN